MPPSQKQKSPPHSPGIQKMGISLILLGVIVIAVGTAALLKSTGEHSTLRNILLGLFGMTLCASGFYTWGRAKKIMNEKT